MQLTPIDRMNLIQIIPKEGSFVTLKIIRELQMKLSFSEEEIKEYIVKKPDETGKLVDSLNPDKVFEKKELDIGEKGKEIIKEALKKLNDEKKLHISMFSLYEEFMGEA